MTDGEVVFTTTLRISADTLTKLKRVRRELSAIRNEDLSMSEVIDILVNEYDERKKKK